MSFSTIYFITALQQLVSHEMIQVIYHAIRTAGTTISFATGADGLPNIIGATKPPPNPEEKIGNKK